MFDKESISENIFWRPWTIKNDFSRPEVFGDKILMFHFFPRSTETFLWLSIFCIIFSSPSSPRDGLLSFKHSEKCRNNSKKLGGWVDSVIVKGRNFCCLIFFVTFKNSSLKDFFYVYAKKTLNKALKISKRWNEMKK